MYVNVEGAKSKQTVKLIEDALQYAKDQLMPNIENLFIDVEVIEGFFEREGMNGETIYEGYPSRYATIALDPAMEFKEFLITLLHEMVHVKQYINRELDGSKWKGKYHKGSYADAPWEKEAYELESSLLEGFLNTKKEVA
jgi:hypothetical protein